jgi:tetratricopeptide (TPR) repeat protein
MVESSVIPIADVIYEHRLYLPSAGAFLAVSSGVYVISQRARKRWSWTEKAFFALCMVIVITLSATTYLRNIIWRDEIRLWQDVIEKSPNKARPQYNLGVAYKDKGMTEMAIKHYRLALMIKPEFPKARNNLGVAYKDKGMLREAMEQYRIAARLDPEDAGIRFNLGVTYLDFGLLEEARREFEIAVKIQPDHNQARHFLNYVNRELSRR